MPPSLLAQFEFEYPARLYWLAVLPVMLYFAYRSSASASSGRRVASCACRSLIVTLLIVALAGLVSRSLTDQRLVIFAVDASQSVDGDGRKAAEQSIEAALDHQAHHHVAFLPFADRPGKLQHTPDIKADGRDVTRSDPGAAVQLAAASIPADFVPLVVLLSDGNETQGDLAKAALGAGVPVCVVPLKSFAGPEVCLADLAVPDRVVPGTELPVEVLIRSNCDGPANLELYRGSELVQQAELTLRSGDNRQGVRIPAGIDPTIILTAKVSASRDTFRENNQRRAAVVAERQLRVLLVDAEPQAVSGFRARLAGAGMTVAVRSPDQLPADVGALDAADLVILSDVAPASLPAAKLDSLQRYVHDLGGGLILLGGDKAFGEAAFRDTVLERMSPVTAVEATEAKKTVLAMVLVIDRSKSMDEDRRIDLAKVAAKESVRILEPYDKAGVMAFSDDAQWIAELAPVSNKTELLGRIDALQTYGQTQMYEAVERAVLALEQTVADRRHIILLTDGIPAPGDFREIAQRMADEGITLSTVSISKGAEQAMLQEMARIAGGRHNHCDDPADVPKILVQETRVAASDEGLQPFRPFALRSLPGLDVASAPPLLGFARTNPRSDAEPLLFAVAGHPLLSWRRYGAGVTVAFTSDIKDRWARQWQSWPGFGPFWKRLIDHAARRPKEPNLEVSLQRVRDAVTITADLVDDKGGFVNGVRLTANVTAPGASPTLLMLEQTAPGRYQAPFVADAPGEYTVRVATESTAGGNWQQDRVMYVDYPDELRLEPTNDKLLRNVAAASGGIYNPDPTAVFAPDGRTAERVRSFASWLLLAAVLLFVGDVALRRLRF
jgi:Mg-chelatase subunit ChlD